MGFRRFLPARNRPLLRMFKMRKPRRRKTSPTCCNCGAPAVGRWANITFHGNPAPSPLAFCCPCVLKLVAALGLVANVEITPVTDKRLTSLVDQWDDLGEPGRESLAETWRKRAERN